MKVFCDTNVIVAAFRDNHPHHQAARPVLERIAQGKDEGFIAAHSLAEIYAVLTRMPSPASPSVTWQLISGNILNSFTIVTLTAREYADVLQFSSEEGVEGGRIYDALLLKAAAKSEATRVLTFNVSHFQSLASEALRSKIVAP